MKKPGISDRTRYWLSLSPLAVFLCIYLFSSLLAGDFYKAPVSSAFLLATIYAALLVDGPIEKRTAIFAKGAGNPSVLMMIGIFVLAGAFASTAKAIGAIDATVNLTLLIMPEKLLLAGLFLTSCFVSMSIGTSVGTVAALVPIASGIASEIGVSIAMVTAVILGGSFFGDNLSFISDTTVVATKTQGCSMADKFKANVWLAGPAALITTAIYVFIGREVSFASVAGDISIVKLIPYIVVMVLALRGVNVQSALVIGLAMNAVIGITGGTIDWLDFLLAMGEGITEMSGLIIVTILAGGLLELIKYNGGIQLIIKCMSFFIRGRKSAEAVIATLVSLANLCTANNTIAIITVGDIAKNISESYGLNSKKVASILDTFSCITQCIIPYGVQMLMAVGLTKVSSMDITSYMYYPLMLFLVASASILFGFPRRYSVR